MPDRLLSILIPVYNTDATPLVNALQAQLRHAAPGGEIRVYDDASPDETYHSRHGRLADDPAITYRKLAQNVGRARMRNLLAEEATGEWLLFLDADSAVPHGDFLKHYLKRSNQAHVLAGGTYYTPRLPSPAVALRWHYGRHREQRTAADRALHPYRSLTLNNLLIRRDVFLSIRLDETLRTYGHEDTRFGWELAQRRVPLLHIDNPVLHLGLEPNAVFLNKTREGVRNLKKLYRQEGLGQDTALVQAAHRLEPKSLQRLFIRTYDALAPLIEQNLHATSPSLRAFDLFKLREWFRDDS
ncbi:hypothetical protein SAMN05421823_101150 [Catalinimonas alkaloidigena]|uniref:Glycosyltransferase 2-like domain-containing protein n=1 Tax=Catalinimonas alkaloidigena TaxID=1075417 RepID=A0A1G8WPL7_9BACT|nr:glycosyltransferase family 2 protein [Catalinimonas alkaloidigena]SDJ80342.1 hypothetical protein SAMN05421823_101150 [Catalinimonas alkaloidigena]